MSNDVEVKHESEGDLQGIVDSGAFQVPCSFSLNTTSVIVRP